MNWYLKDKFGKYISRIDAYSCTTVDAPVGPLSAIVFTGTRDYMDGIVFGMELLGQPRYEPELVEKEVAHGIQTKT